MKKLRWQTIKFWFVSFKPFLSTSTESLGEIQSMQSFSGLLMKMVTMKTKVSLSLLPNHFSLPGTNPKPGQSSWQVTLFWLEWSWLCYSLWLLHVRFSFAVGDITKMVSYVLSFWATNNAVADPDLHIIFSPLGPNLVSPSTGSATAMDKLRVSALIQIQISIV